MFNGLQLRVTQSERHSYQPHFERLERRLLLTAETEPNDSLTTANAIAVVDTVSGQLSTLSDVDFFKINLAAGSRFRVGEINYYDAEGYILPPAIEILDDSASVLAASNDGSDFEITANQTTMVYVRVTSASAFGPTANKYAFKTTVSAYSGVVEAEPNNTRATANSISGGTFRGSLSATDAADFYSVNLNANSAVYVNFNGTPEQRPGVRIWSPTGTLISSALAGQGLALNVESAGLYTIEVLDNSAAGQTQSYVGVFQSSQSAQFFSDRGDNFSQASEVPAARDSTFIGGI